MNSGRGTILVLLSLSAAYDTINHAYFLQKLLQTHPIRVQCQKLKSMAEVIGGRILKHSLTKWKQEMRKQLSEISKRNWITSENYVNIRKGSKASSNRLFLHSASQPGKGKWTQAHPVRKKICACKGRRKREQRNSGWRLEDLAKGIVNPSCIMQVFGTEFAANKGYVIDQLPQLCAQSSKPLRTSSRENKVNKQPTLSQTTVMG